MAKKYGLTFNFTERHPNASFPDAKIRVYEGDKYLFTETLSDRQLDWIVSYVKDKRPSLWVKFK